MSDLESEIYDIATQMLQGQIDLIEGCHNITSLSYQLNKTNNVFLFFKGIASETEHFPFSKIRDTCSSEYLVRLDLEKENYLIQIKEDIFKACLKLQQIINNK